MANSLTAPPALSTPADPAPRQITHGSSRPKRPDHEVFEVYEVARTAHEIVAGGWKRIALQFPDAMLADAPRVAEALRTRFSRAASLKSSCEKQSDHAAAERRMYIMADTSYSACCVDEIAAEHIDADVVVHYGRACLSPTSRLPVIYVFTRHGLPHAHVMDAFSREFQDPKAHVVLMADVTYQDHLPALASTLRGAGYEHLLSTEIVHRPAGILPNRRVVDEHGDDALLGDGPAVDLHQYSVFHIASPPAALLLALSSRVKTLVICSTPATEPDPAEAWATEHSARTTRALLGRRYAKVLSLSTAGVIGILVNTLSVSTYLSTLEQIKRQIAQAGKKSYTVVVGKLNAAKLANFAEVEGWVVVGCWESSLVEEDAGFFQPVVTPFELSAALAPDDQRVWGATWWGGMEPVDAVGGDTGGLDEAQAAGRPAMVDQPRPAPDEADENGVDAEESEPPEFDLRTGKLVSHSRPMRPMPARWAKADAEATSGTVAATTSSALAVRPRAEMAAVNGIASPGAEFLQSKRTWQGLASDFDGTEGSMAPIEEGRNGVARGYTIRNGEERR